MSDKPKERITGESVEEAVAARDMEWWEQTILVDNVAPTPEAGKAWAATMHQYAFEQGHREGWDAAIQVAALKVCDLLMPGPHGPWLRDNLRALPYPGIAKKAQEGEAQ